ncbi:hypothetical protein EV368DRAFT_47176 [Lentinula lateritia]|nr:hypothetical protein EV368DRAFT_47176 [Lentinula lateritia]
MNSLVIQSHLYNSFLSGQTSDVSIRISGAFSATYRLHRVVLIQAGFWKDLFTGGFVESSVKLRTTGRKSDTRILDVVFDDRNISRAAFELSLSRLYGGGPPLHIHPSLVPISTHPLTSGSVLPSSSLLPYAPGCQPATPEFLISLLATSLYLSIPSLASEALTGILRTIGPRTVQYYLDFALGRTKLRNADRPAVGLEGLAKDLEEGEHGSEYSDLDMSTCLPVENRTARNRNNLPRFKLDNTVSSTQFYYGSISDKIGEACACWLARWGVDMFVEEKKIENGFEGVPLTSDTDSSRPSRSTSSAWTPKWTQSNVRSIPKFFTATAVGAGYEGLSLSWIHVLISSDSFFIPAPSLYDTLSEERYAFAKGVVELRRAVRTKCSNEDEQWDAFFSTCIYYTNMSTDAVINISQDISPSTGRPYVDLRTLQQAVWEAELVKNTIKRGNQNTSSHKAVHPVDKLGFAKPVSSISSTSATDNSLYRVKPYFTIPANESLRIGDTITTGSATLGDTAASSDDRTGEQPEKTAPIAKTSKEGTFFGLRDTICYATLTDDHSFSFTSSPAPFLLHSPSPFQLPPTQLLSSHPPLRFSVEFFNLEMLKEKDRIHSRTVWYAGSLWNVYVQVVQRKDKNSANTLESPKDVQTYRSPGSGLLPNYQLGVYLHRQSPTENTPPFSAPDPFSSGSRDGTTRNMDYGIPGASASTSQVGWSTPSPLASVPTQSAPSAITVVPPASTLSSTDLPLPDPPFHAVVNSQSIYPYTDPRQVVSVYFSVNCASPTGSAQTRFRSAPDIFKVGQSWGWKSSGLLGGLQGSASTNVSDSDGGLEAALIQMDHELPAVGHQVSLRATVVLGIV